MLVWALVGAALCGILASKFSFIVPLIFYNKYIDEPLWEYRFRVMTVQLVTLPLMLDAMFQLWRFSQTRVDLHAMAKINKLKVDKSDRRLGPSEGNEGESFLDAAVKRSFGGVHETSTSSSALGGKTSVIALAGLSSGKSRGADADSGAGVGADGADDGGDGGEGGGWSGAVEGAGKDGSLPEEELNTRFEEVHQAILEQRQEQSDMGADMVAFSRMADELQSELDEIVLELRANQEQINAGVKELETLIVRRFEAMHDEEQAEKVAKEALQVDADRKLGGDEDEEYLAGLDPAARRQLRRQRLVDEQRKRIAVEESEKADADAQIRSMQAELAKLLEANGRLQHKVEACEHNVDETRDAIEDMSFQLTQCQVQKENSLAVLTGEVNYLTEHQVMVQRKASELTSRSAEVEGAIHAAGYKLQRVHHASELSTADRRRDLEGLTNEVEVYKHQFEQLKNDVRTLYNDKAALHKQLGTAQAEAADVEACVAQYRKSAATVWTG